MKAIRIGGGAGFGGDRLEPALDIIRRGNVDYLMLECLAERTIALAQLDKLKNPSGGFNPFLAWRMSGIMPLLREHPVKIVTNMGAACPLEAAKKTAQIARDAGLDNLRIAAVSGDDLTEQIEDYYDLPIMETGEPLRGLKDRIISANAYLGGQGIACALGQGADMVITGRVADPALAVGPLVYETGRAWDDWDFLGKATVAGHLLECAGQVTGGYFADPGIKDVPALWNLGFPILTFSEDGEMTIEKLPDTGGLVGEATVTEQLLYEIQNPAEYLTPDVVADFSLVTIRQAGIDRVRVSGGAGKPKTGSLKVSVGYLDGWIGEGEISYAGANAEARARLAGEIILRRLDVLPIAHSEARVDLVGVNSLLGRSLIQAPPAEVRLRVAIKTDTQEQAEMIGREVEALYTNGPAGGGGARAYTHKVVAIASILVPEPDARYQITWQEI